MFRSCFVARVAAEKDRSVELFCGFTDPSEANKTAEVLPPAQALGSFCFPLGPSNVKAKEYMAPEEYSFTLTAGDGSRLHGFCRTFLPPRSTATIGRTNSSMRYPQVLCVISQYPWFAFYFKTLQVTEQLLKQDNVLNNYKAAQLAQTHPAGLFLSDLCQQCPKLPIPGKVIRVDYPKLEVPLSISPPKRIGWTEGADQLLNSSDKFIELEIPPDFGNGAANAGIPLARLLWHVPRVECLMTLLASLLLERRVILVAPQADTVSAAVHAAAALLYPFTWQHIYLPLLPVSLKDYLTAPMPFLIGLQASMLPLLKHLPMDEVVLIDLELGTCEPPPGSPRDDARLLPWSDRLHAALQVVYDGLRSPTEYESTPIIAHVLQEYFLRLMGRYREFIQPEGTARAATGAAPAEEQAPAGTSGQRTLEGIRARPSFRQSPKAQTGRAGADDDGFLRGDGFQFDQLAFVASHGRNDKAQQFVSLFRHSQLYEVFINERLKLASQEYKTADTFECKVGEAASRRAKSFLAPLNKAHSLVTTSNGSVGNLSDLMQRGRNMVKTYVEKHRLTSEDNELFPPSRDGSFVRPSGSSFGGRSGSSFSTRRVSHSNGPPNLQRFSGSQGGPPNLQRFSAVARDVTSVKAQINGILHEDSLPYYDGSAQMPTQQVLPVRQNSVSSHAAVGSRNRGTPTRLAQQGSQSDAGDLGISGAAPMSRTDSGHISGQHPHRNDHWQSRLRGPSSEQAHQRAGPTQSASPFASIEAMLSSIPETLSSIPSMPSMPSVPSMSEIERSMQSGWSSFTGSLGLNAPAAASEQQQQQPANTGWTAFEDAPNTAHMTAPAQQPTPSTSAQVDPFAELSELRIGSTAAQAASNTQASEQQLTSTGGSSEQSAAPRSASFTMPRRQATGLQSIDPLNAAKELASMPLRSMPSAKQPLTPRGSSQHQLSSQPSSSPCKDDRDAGSVVASPSNDWSDFTTAPSTSHTDKQQAQGPESVQALQQAGVTNDVGVDPWADWTGHTESTSQLQAHFQAQPSPRLDAGSKEASLLDM